MYHEDTTNASLKADDMYRADSIHYVMIPEARDDLIDKSIERQISLLQRVVNINRVARVRKRISVKMPIGAIHVVHSDAQVIKDLRAVESFIRTECNVQGSVILDTDSENKVSMLSAVPNFKVLGRIAEYRRKMKSIQKGLSILSNDDVVNALSEGQVDIDGDVLKVSEGHIEIKRKFKGDEKVRVLGTHERAHSHSRHPSRAFISHHMKMPTPFGEK